MSSSLEQLSALASKLSEMPSSENEEMITTTSTTTATTTSNNQMMVSPSTTEIFNRSDSNICPPKMEIIVVRNNNISPATNTITTNPLLSTSNRCQDWSRQITVEERKFIRDKIKAAYLKKIADSFEDLLETCVAIEEELVFSSAPSRLDYFKTGIQFEKRVAEKRFQLKNADMDVQSVASEMMGSSSTIQPKPIKRAKTNH